MKPKLTYAEFVAAQEAKKRQGTVAWLIERFIAEMNGLDGHPPVRTLGDSHRFILKRLQREPIGAKMLVDLNKRDIIEHSRWRIGGGVKPQTVNQDVQYLSGVLKYAGSAWEDCEDVSDAPVATARPFLKKHNLIGKGEARRRRPTDQEIEQLIQHFREGGYYIDMVTITRWQRASSRRIGETCRLQWADWNREEHTMLVRKMKDPRNRNKSKVVALPPAAQEILCELWEKRNPEEPRIFPYRAASCSAAYTRAKKVCGIDGLRLHDSRRDCYTRLVEDAGYSLEEAILVTGHETIAIPQRTYLAMKPENFKLGPKARRIAVTEQVMATMGHTGMLEAGLKAAPGPLPESLRKDSPHD